MPEAKWFVTFVGNRLGKYAPLFEPDYNDARREAFSQFGREWGFIYPIDDLERQINEYRLEEL